ncbi:hypothetical protein WJX84_006928 [Apatococcus fuscideae]|uniref:Uncharacterized protein n=1 Tax=Apatococcus fuscideae TaxID=2026836 RepID=A0AAW1TBC8_9CHLO
MLRELRDRLDQAGRDMAVMREAEDAQLATVRKLKADLARRDTQLKDSLHSVNQNLHEVAADLLSDASQAKQSCHMSWRLQQDMCHDLLTKLLQELHQLSERSQRKMTSTSSAAFPRSQNVTRVSSREDPRFSQGSWETNTLHRPLHLADGDCSLNSIDQLQAELWQAECGLHDI